MLGGRTNHWGRISLRNGPYDFKPRSRDGLGFDWPIGYADMAPYYDKVEMLVGIYGANDGLENTPDSPEGCLLPPPKPLVSDLLVHKYAGTLGIPVIAGHRAVLTRQLDWKNSPAKLHPGNPAAQQIIAADMKQRGACFWTTPCGNGCSIRANYQSPTVHLPPALATGKLDIVTDAMVNEITLGKDGRASGVHFIDRTTTKGVAISARVVVLDDPMSAVDTQTERLLVERLRPALEGRTVVIATQRLSTVQLADRAVVLVDGRVAEQGPPTELLQAGGAFTALFGDELVAA